jgi:hypothetical protein
MPVAGAAPNFAIREYSKTVPQTTAVLAAAGHPERRCKATMVLSASTQDGEVAMKIIVSTFVALSLLAGLAVSASALDARSFYEQQERQSGGSAN